MENEEQTPTRKVIPPSSLVAIICLAVGLGVGYVYGTGTSRFEITIEEKWALKLDKRTGETWLWDWSNGAAVRAHAWKRLR